MIFLTFSTLELFLFFKIILILYCIQKSYLQKFNNVWDLFPQQAGNGPNASRALLTGPLPHDVPLLGAGS